MAKSRRMNLTESIEHLHEDVAGLLLGHGLGAVLEFCRHRLTLHIVHHVVDCAVSFEEVVHTDYVRVAE